MEAVVNIREVIEKLHEMAEWLPDGLDSEHLPGQPAAVAAGCICDPEAQQPRPRPLRDGSVQMVIKDGCPVHPKLEDRLIRTVSEEAV